MTTGFAALFDAIVANVATVVHGKRGLDRVGARWRCSPRVTC